MLQALIIVAILLFIVVFAMVFRVQVLVDILRGNKRTEETSSNHLNGYLFLLWFIFMFGAAAFTAKDLLIYPIDASEHGGGIDTLFWITMAIITIVFVGTNFVLFYFAFKYRYKKETKALFYPHNMKLELIWTVIPAIVLTILVFSGLRIWWKITDEAPKDTLKVQIMGKQFNWMIKYAGEDGKLGKYNFRKIDDINQMGMDFEDEAAFDDFVPREMHLPVNKPVELDIRARDVLHSVFLPHFRQKMDAVPGMPTRMWFTPVKTTSQMQSETGKTDFVYEIVCTEICGEGHFGMRSTLVVDTQDEFDAWLKEQKSFLSKNPDYLDKVPDELKNIAKKQIEEQTAAN